MPTHLPPFAVQTLLFKSGHLFWRGHRQGVVVSRPRLSNRLISQPDIASIKKGQPFTVATKVLPREPERTVQPSKRFIYAAASYSYPKAQRPA